VRRDTTDDGITYQVTFSIASRAKRRAQRENGIRVQLMDRGKCYQPVVDASNIAFNTLIQPQESIDVMREFRLPRDSENPVVSIAHNGWFPGCVIIGDSQSLLHKRPVVRLD
jgi:hypothetical protein